MSTGEYFVSSESGRYSLFRRTEGGMLYWVCGVTSAIPGFAPVAEAVEADVRSRLVAALEAEWRQICAGNVSLENCETCRAFDAAITTVRDG